MCISSFQFGSNSDRVGGVGLGLRRAMNRANVGYRSVPPNTRAVAPPPLAVAADQTPAVADTIAAFEVLSARRRGPSPPAVAAVQTPAVANAAPDGTPMPTRAPPVVAPDEAPIAAPDEARMRTRARVSFDADTAYVAPDVDAVGDSEPVASATRRVDTVGDSESDAESVVSDSIAGDTASDTEDPAYVARSRDPLVRIHGSIEPHVWHASSVHNSDPEVGNTAVMFGNWGTRGTTSSARPRRLMFDRQLTKSPAHLIMLAETTPHCKLMLEHPLLSEPDIVPDPQSRVQGRPVCEHWVVRGEEDEAALLIAVRKDVATGIQLLFHTVNPDFHYRTKGKDKIAKTRMMVCAVFYKQNLGHIGTKLVAMGVHGHCLTMKNHKPSVLVLFWDRVAALILEHGVHVLSGDWNMAFTQVRSELKQRKVLVTCAAWTPWLMGDAASIPEFRGKDPPIGHDSCGIFMVGPDIEVKAQWGPSAIPILTAVAGAEPRLPELPNDKPDTWWRRVLHTYDRRSAPGQHWSCYRPTQPRDGIDFARSLHDLLTPATSQTDLDLIPKRDGSFYRAYLRVKQKPLDPREWLVQGAPHNGAHFPLCIFFGNSTWRSKEKQIERSAKGRGRHVGGGGGGRGPGGGMGGGRGSGVGCNGPPPPPVARIIAPFTGTHPPHCPAPVQQPIGSQDPAQWRDQSGWPEDYQQWQTWSVVQSSSIPPCQSWWGGWK